jgi:hypothetical protein
MTTVPEVSALSGEALEAVARATHDRYRANQAGRKAPDDPAMAQWDDLLPTVKEANRDQAASIFGKLRKAGYTVHEVSGRKPMGLSFTESEIELMAEMEHDRWVAERRKGGWTSGDRRDVQHKVTPYLVGWQELPEEVREYDREAVRAIPELLAGVGLELRRERTSAG